MLAGVQPCFQLLRIGLSAGESARDLYTFRPAQNHSVFRLGRAAELCDVTLDSPSVSRIHAELEAERETGEGVEAQEEEGWRVHIKDRSSHGETRGLNHTQHHSQPEILTLSHPPSVIVEENEVKTHLFTGITPLLLRTEEVFY